MVSTVISSGVAKLTSVLGIETVEKCLPPETSILAVGYPKNSSGTNRSPSVGDISMIVAIPDVNSIFVKVAARRSSSSVPTRVGVTLLQSHSS
jgi:hypothetical protein